MKIAFVHSFYRSGEPSGENLAVKMHASALREAGHDVRVIGRETDDFIDSPLYPLRAGFTVVSGRGPSPLEELKDFAPDIVHVHNLFPNWSEKWASELDVPLVVTIHNFRPLCSAGTLSRDGCFCDLCPTKGSHHAVIHSCYGDSLMKTLPLAVASRKSRTNFLLEAAAKIVFLSESSRALYLHHRKDLDPGKTEVIPNFAEIEVSGKAGISWRNRKSKPWLYVGRLSPEKGIVPLLNSWPADEPLIVVGSGPSDAKSRLAATGKKVEFLGQLPPSQVRSIMLEARALVFPSITPEQSPLTVIEALASGLPILAKEGNAGAEIVKSYGPGEIFSSFVNLGAAVIRLQTRSGELSDCAKACFSGRFTKEVWLRRMSECYEGTL